MKHNPVTEALAAQLSQPEVRMLDALETAWRILDAAAEGLRQDHAHPQAELLEEFSETLKESTENIADEILGEREELYGGELDVSGQEIEQISLEEDFVQIYHGWLQFLKNPRYSSHVFDSTDESALAEVLRHAVTYHMRQPLKKGVTDKQLVEAAKDAYEDRARRQRR